MSAIAVPAATTPVAAPYAKGFSTLSDETTIAALPVTGELPAWLTGSLLRTGPARFEVGEQSYRHWFDGLTMLHRFTFGEGEVGYGNRFVRGKTWAKAEQTGEIPYVEFATDPCRSVFKRFQTLFAGGPEFGDNANVNVVRLGERYLSMTESPISVQFDPETLQAAGVSFTPPGQITTAHPHLDRATRGMLNYAVKLGARSEYRFFHLAPNATEPEVVARIPVRHPGYVHSFGLTKHYFVLAEFPWVVNPLRLATAGKPYVENYRWEPARGTRFHLVERTTGRALEPIRTDACFAFHHLNAYETPDGRVVVDLEAYDDPGLVEDLYLENMRAGGRFTTGELRRYELDPAAQSASCRRLVDGPFELGRINYGRCNERHYRYAWGLSAHENTWLSRIVRADVQEGTTTTWDEPHLWPGEPVFVPEPGGVNEDDGVLLSVVLDDERGTSLLLVLDARDLTELARAEVPHHIPFSFHGQFAAERG